MNNQYIVKALFRAPDSTQLNSTLNTLATRLNSTQLSQFWKCSELRKLSDFSWVELSRVGRSEQGLRVKEKIIMAWKIVFRMTYNVLSGAMKPLLPLCLLVYNVN